MYRIREVDGADFYDELKDLHVAVFEDRAPLVDFTAGYWWIAFRDDEPAAFIGAVQSLLGPHVGYFCRVGVLPRHRGQSLQRRLMRAMEAKAKRVGWTCIVTDTRDNPHSANNIIRAGYDMFAPADPWAHLDACYWVKDLSYDRRQRSRAPRRQAAGNRSHFRSGRRDRAGAAS